RLHLDVPLVVPVRVVVLRPVADVEERGPLRVHGHRAAGLGPPVLTGLAIERARGRQRHDDQGRERADRLQGVTTDVLHDRLLGLRGKGDRSAAVRRTRRAGSGIHYATTGAAPRRGRGRSAPGPAPAASPENYRTGARRARNLAPRRRGRHANARRPARCETKTRAPRGPRPEPAAAPVLAQRPNRPARWALLVEVRVGVHFVPADRDALVPVRQELVPTLLVPAPEVPEPPHLEPDHGATLEVQDLPRLIFVRRLRDRVHPVVPSLLVDQRRKLRQIAPAQRRLRLEYAHLRSLRERYVRAPIRILLLLEERRKPVLAVPDPAPRRVQRIPRDPRIPMHVRPAGVVDRVL